MFQTDFEMRMAGRVRDMLPAHTPEEAARLALGRVRKALTDWKPGLVFDPRAPPGPAGDAAGRTGPGDRAPFFAGLARLAGRRLRPRRGAADRGLQPLPERRQQRLVRGAPVCAPGAACCCSNPKPWPTTKPSCALSRAHPRERPGSSICSGGPAGLIAPTRSGSRSAEQEGDGL